MQMIYEDHYVKNCNGPSVKPIVYEIDENGCWNCFSHTIDKDGYPRIRRKMKNWAMHRYIYTLEKGEIKKDMVIRHTCDNTFCINPDHLIVGTVLDNTRDKIERNRHCYGEFQGSSKLTNKQVIKIKQDERHIKEIANDYGVTMGTIWKIKTGYSWNHIKDENICPHCSGTGLIEDHAK